MTLIDWRFVDFASQLLEPREREAVLGDLAEAGESAWQALLAVVGLFIRRQAILWKSWQPWLAAFGVAFPGSLLLMGVSVSVSRTFLQISNIAAIEETSFTSATGFSLLLCQTLLLLGWSWTGGYVVGSLSRRTLWLSALFASLPCFFCLSRFHVETLSKLSLLLFLLPAVWGVATGLRTSRIKLGPALALAATITLLTFSSGDDLKPWAIELAMSWPAWYLVSTARKSTSLRINRT